MITRGVSDVAFPIFADTDFEFLYPRISDADIIHFTKLGYENEFRPQMMKKT